MKKNGFTLMELLAVIIILTLMGMIVVPIVENSINSGKDDLYIAQIDSVKASLKKYAIEEGGFGGLQAAIFNIVQILGNAVAWILIAPVLDILIYKEPANKVFAQGVTAAVTNLIIVAILGSLLAFGYSKVKTKSSSLKEEND